MAIKDFYKTLGVPSNADLENIKTAYRKLSKKYHPDVNDGDTFFEERFKEIQEAYEILSDSSKKQQYDFIRTNFSNLNNGNYEKHEEIFKKKEEYLKKQKEIFEKREELFRRRKEGSKIKEKEKVIQSKKYADLFLILLLIAVSFILIYLTVDKKNKNIISSLINSPGADTIAESYFEDYDPVINEKLNARFKNSESGKTFDGIWTGMAFQYDTKESQSIKLTCNSKKKSYLIEYPSLGCSGNLFIEKITIDEIEFRENIQEGAGICNNTGRIKLKKLDNRKLLYLYYPSNSTNINAKGQLNK